MDLSVSYDTLSNKIIRNKNSSVPYKTTLICIVECEVIIDGYGLVMFRRIMSWWIMSGWLMSRWIMSGSVMSGWIMSGWIMSGWVMSGWIMSRWVMSGWICRGGWCPGRQCPVTVMHACVHACMHTYIHICKWLFRIFCKVIHPRVALINCVSRKRLISFHTRVESYNSIHRWLLKQLFKNCVTSLNVSYI